MTFLFWSISVTEPRQLTDDVKNNLEFHSWAETDITSNATSFQINYGTEFVAGSTNYSYLVQAISLGLRPTSSSNYTRTEFEHELRNQFNDSFNNPNNWAAFKQYVDDHTFVDISK